MSLCVYVLAWFVCLDVWSLIESAVQFECKRERERERETGEIFYILIVNISLQLKRLHLNLHHWFGASLAISRIFFYLPYSITVLVASH